MNDYVRSVVVVDEERLRLGLASARRRKRELTRYACANCGTASSLCRSCATDERELRWIELALALDKARSSEPAAVLSVKADG